MIEWHVTVTNAGPSTAENVEITDTLPGAVTFLSGGGDGFSCAESGGTVSCSRATVPVGTYNVAITAQAPDEPQRVTNVCVIDTTTDPTPGDSLPDDCEDTVDVERAVDLSLWKESIPATVTAADEFIYRIHLENAGPSTAIDVEITDTLPADVTFVSASGPATCQYNSGPHTVACAVSPLDAGDALAIDITVQAPDEGGQITNVCVADYPGIELDPSTLDCEADTEVTPESDLTVEKTASAPTVAAGSDFYYDIVVNNAGPSTAEDVAISDDLPAELTFVSVAADTPFGCAEAAGTVSCSAASLPVGTYNIRIHVTAPDDPGQVTNVCVLTTPTDDPTPIDPADCEDPGVEVTPEADLQTIKTAIDAIGGSPVSEVNAGDDFVWHIRVTNNGPSTAEAVQLVDDVPASLTVIGASGTLDSGGSISCSVAGNQVTCPIGDIANGDAADIHVDVTAPADGGPITNVCVIDTPTDDPAPPVCDGSVDVNPVADLDVSKVAAIPDSDGNAGPPVTEVDAGSTFLYLVTVSNSGPSDAEDVTLVDDLPAEINVVEVSGWDDGCSLSGVQVTCQAATLAAGDSLLLQVEAEAPAAEVDIVNIAAVSATTDDPDSANDSVEHTLSVIEDPIVGIAKDATMVSFIGGSLWEARLLFTVENSGNVPLEDVQITDDLTAVFPASVAWTVADVSVSGDLATVNPAFDGDLDTNLLAGDEQLPVGGTAEVRLEIEFDPGAQPGPFFNQAEATALDTTGDTVSDLSHDGLDPNPDDTHPNNHSEPTPIDYVEDPGIGLAKWVEDVVYEGDGVQRFEVAILARNYGNVPLNNVQVTDDLAETFFGGDDPLEPGEVVTVGNLSVTGDLSATDPAYDGDTVTTLLSGTETLPIDGEATIRFDLTIELEPDEVGPWLNRARGIGTSPGGLTADDWSHLGQDPNPSGSADPTDDNDPTPIAPLSADIATAKQLVTANPMPGQNVTWELEVTNAGPDDAHDVVVVDTLPAEVTFVSAGGGGFACSNAAGTVTCTRPLLSVGETATISVSAQAPADGGDITNICDSESAIADPDLSNNVCEATDPVAPVANISVSKAADGTVYAGEPFTYLIVIDQQGPSPAENVTVTDPLDPALTFESVSADAPFDCGNDGNDVTCQADTLPVGQYTVAINVIAPDEIGPIDNVCAIASDTDNGGAGTPDCQTTVTPEPSADIAITKAASPSQIQPGQEFDWILTVDQQGPSDAADVVIIDDVPAPSQVIAAEGDAPFTCSTNANEVTCQADTLPVGQYQLRITTQAPDEPGPIQNACVLESGTHVPRPPICEGGGVIGEPPMLMTTATAGPARVLVGEPFWYTVRVANDGDSSIEDLAVDMAMQGPGVLDGVEPRSLGSCNGATNTAVACIADIVDAGDYLVVQLQLTGTAAGRHQLTAASSAGTELDPDSVLEAQAGVDIVPAGIPTNPAYPIPTLSRLGVLALALTVLLIGGLTVRRFTV